MPIATVEELMFRRDEWDAIIAEAVRPALDAYLLDAAQREFARAEGLGITGAFDVTNPKVREFVERYSFKFAERINATAAARLRGILGPALEEGLDQRAIRKLILEDAVLGEAVTPYRAEMIARTEVNRAYTEGAKEGWRELNAAARNSGMTPPVIGMEWRANQDACEFCMAMHGKLIGGTEGRYFGVGDSLDVEGAGSMSFTYEDVGGPPLHPMCRCHEEPVFAEEYR